jgi:hypothetical protein
MTTLIFEQAAIIAEAKCSELLQLSVIEAIKSAITNIKDFYYSYEQSQQRYQYMLEHKEELGFGLL